MQKLLFTHLLVVLLTLSSFSYGDDKLLIVGSEQDYPPFALGLTDSTADGFTVELWRAVAAEAHINSTIRVLPFRDILYEFKAKEIDVLINLAQSDERRLFADFTVPHVIVRGAIFVRKGESSISSEAALQNKRIIVLSADLAHDYAVSKGWKNQLTLVGTAEEGFQLLASGQHDALLLSKLAGQQTLEKLGLTNIEALHIPIGFAQKFSFAVHKGNAELLAKINEGLALTKVNGVYDALYDKWFGVYEEKALLPTVLKYLAPVVGLFLLIMGISFYRRNHESKQYVQKLQANKASLEADLLADITLRKGLETELKNMIARKDMAINALNAGVFVWRFDTNELIWDKCMRRLYGVPEDVGDNHLYYDSWLSRIHPDDKKNTESLLLGAIAGTNSFDTEFRIVLDNDIRYIRAAAILERDENAYPIQMVGVNLDITDIKTAEARIMESNASLEKQVEMRTSELNTALEVAKSANSAKTDFLANMSHEIRTPMNAVIGLAFLLQKQELNLIARDMVNKIDDAGRSLLGVINECLDFSKIEANLLEIEYVPFRLSDILDNLTSIMNILGANKPIKLCIAPAPKGSDYLRGDPIRLEQILINLVSNAIKFTEKGEVVVEVNITDSVSTSTANQINIHFSVRDTGIGISREKHESIFQPFVQADNSTTRVYGGSGLGLAISRRLVDLMGGTLQLTSEIGVGSEFFFDLTFTVIGNIKADAVPSLPPQNVLIIDNNNIARKLLEATVISLGWKAQVVDSDIKALQMLTKKGANYFDFLLLDWSVVAGNGKQIAIRIQQQFGKKHCPIIIMVTAHNRDILLTHSSDNAYFDNIISKPVTGLSLTNAVLEVKMKHGELVYDHNQSASAEPLKDKYNPSVSAEPLKGLNVLVVDDSEINREVARQILTGEGATIEDAENGLDAINQLKAKPNYFHVVLMDVQMPVMDGYTATQQIRMLPELKHLPIIALTAGAFKSHRTAALEAGMDDFIAKPFDVDELVACVHRLAQPKQIQKTSVTIAPQLPHTSYKDMPLIDIDNGLKKWRDPALYQKHLRLFLTQHAQNVNLVHEKLLNTDNTAALAITHKLLGAAGALSLQRIVHVIKNLDEAIREQDDVKTESECFSLVFAQTIDAIHKYIDDEIPQQTEESTLAVSPISIIKGLEQLIVTLDSDDPDLIEPQLATLAGQLPKAAFDELAIAIENFDFREAETLATVLLTAFFDSTQE
ncbi:MAG: transporter substrate-binding domain-containing protein [Methylococcales bacterium]